MTLIKCPKCGMNAKPNDKFCKECGTSLNSDLSKYVSINKRSLLNKELVDNDIYNRYKIDEEDIENIDNVYMLEGYVDGQHVKRFYYVNKDEISLDEIKIKLMLKQQKTLDVIKTILLFFAILTIIGILFACYEIYQYIQIIS